MRNFLIALCVVSVLGCTKPEPASKLEPVEKITEIQKAPTPAVGNSNRLHQLKDLAKIELITVGGKLTLYCMDTESKRQEGMMMLENKEFKDSEGMIFIFPEIQKVVNGRGFWMKNTIIPLDICYINNNKKIINVGEGKAFSEENVAPSGDYRFVIEVKRGLGTKYGLIAGKKVAILNNLKSE
jgi:uncharacterized protein